MIGSEGTLGIITKAIVNLVPTPNQTVDLLVPFGSFDDAVKAASNIIGTTRVYPVAMEFMDILSVRDTVGHLNLPPLPAQDRAEAYLLLTLEGKDQDELDELAERVGSACLEMGALDVFVASTRTESEKVWNVRRSVGSVQAEKFSHLLSGDVVVPRSETAEFIERTKKILEKYSGLQVTFVGHIGDGNIHPALMDTANRTDKEWIEFSERIYEEVCLLGSQMGGTVSGEHGIGLAKKKVLRQSLGDYPISIMRGIKKVL